MTSRPTSDAPDMQPPLNGLRVLDASNYAAGPLSAQILAGLGATVVKVERPPHGDPERGLWSEMFDAHNRGKHSIVLDLRDDAGEDRRTFDALVAESDVVVENFRPDVALRLGLDLATLSAVQPEIVVVSVSGYGSDGPYAGAPGYEHQYRALAGDLFLSGGATGTVVETWMHSYPVFGYAAAMYAVIGVLAARAMTPRRAAHVQVPLLAAGYAWMFGALRNPAYRDMAAAPAQQTFRAGDGRLLSITTPLKEQFRSLCDVLGLHELAAEAGDDPFTWQYRHNRQLVDAVEGALARDTSIAWVARLREAGVPVAPVLSPEDIEREAQFRALDLGADSPETTLRLPIQGLPTVMLGPAPALDADGEAVRTLGWNGVGDAGAT